MLSTDLLSRIPNHQYLSPAFIYKYYLFDYCFSSVSSDYFPYRFPFLRHSSVYVFAFKTFSVRRISIVLLLRRRASIAPILFLSYSYFEYRPRRFLSRTQRHTPSRKTLVKSFFPVFRLTMFVVKKKNKKNLYKRPRDIGITMYYRVVTIII